MAHPVSRMLRVGLAGVLLALVLPGSGSPAEEEGEELPRCPTLAEALDRAKEDRKLVFLELVAWNCPHCREFEEKVLTSEVFREFARSSMHLVIYDIGRKGDLTAEQAGELQELMTRFQVEYTPTIVVFSPDGEVMLRTQGYKGTPAEGVVGKLSEMKAN